MSVRVEVRPLGGASGRVGARIARRAVVVALAATLVTPFAELGHARAGEVAERLTGYVEMPDGARLHYSVLLPRASGRFPVMMTYSGYSSGSIGGAAYQAGDSTGTPISDNRYLLARGYAVLGVNLRGTACSSGGGFALFSRKWGTDGARMVEWASRQPWSTGRVGMFGGSFNGLTQLFVAAERPRHLAAIVPGMVVVDPWRDVGMPGGVPNVLFPLGWWLTIKATWEEARVTARAEGDAACLRTIDENLASSEPVSPPALQAAHPHIDAWARSHSLVGRTGRIDVPVLSSDNWQDPSTGVRGGYYQDTIRPDRLWYVGANGYHGSVSVTPRFLRRFMEPFLERFVKGRRNGFERRPHLEVWQELRQTDPVRQTAAGLRPVKVRSFDRYPPPTRTYRLALRRGAALSRRPPRRPEPPDRYAYPVKGPSVEDYTFGDGGWGPLDPRWRTGSRAYTSAPLRRTLTLVGSASADLWISTTAPDADVQVTVTEARPNGTEQYVQRGWQRLSERALDRRRSTPTRPVHPLTEAAVLPVPRGRPVPVRVEVAKLGHTFRKGSRIRVWIDTPSTTGQFGFTIEEQPGTNAVWHRPGRASWIVFSRLPGAQHAGERPRRCDMVLAQPCRPDPLTRERAR
jgi:uncharacterized protein